MNEQPSPQPLLKEIAPRNFLSYGPDTQTIPLRNLNVLIGPNGSGKSNLIEALCLMRASSSDATPRDMQSVISRGGGVREWIWQGAPDQPASLSAVFTNPGGRQPIRHYLEFRKEEQSFRLTDERIENETPYANQSRPYFFYHFQSGRPVLNLRDGGQRYLQRENIQPDVSILAQRRDPEQYPEISYIGDKYLGIRVFREWSFGRNTVFREPQRADMPTKRLEEDFSNLGLILNKFARNPRTKKKLIISLQDVYEGIDDFGVSVEGGTVQVFFTEGSFTVPATRLSDGTLRFLCLLAILCDPEPPPLVCIEEPELGLHPDILPKIAALLVEASERMQLIVTTHSDILVDSLSEIPEAVLVCEKREGITSIERLDSNKLRPWLDRYRLGQLWLKGEVGGTRW